MMTNDNLVHYVASLLEVPPSAIGPDADLAALGLDSVRLMMTIEFLEAEGFQPDFALFAEQPNLRAWLAFLEK